MPLAAFLPPAVLPLHCGEQQGAAGTEAGAEAEQPLEAWLLSTALRLERLSAPSDSEAFPALPSPSGARPMAAQAHKPPGGGLAVRLAQEALQRAFPGVPADELRHCLASSQGLLAQACALVSARNPGVHPLPGALGPVRVQAPAPSAGSAGGAGGAGRAEAIARAIAGALAQVETGCSLARLYAACRGEAEALARSRNEAFERSSRAFAANQLAQARAYSSQGQALDRRMRAAHAAAAAQIFGARNSAPGGEGSSSSGAALDVAVSAHTVVRVRVWDLHGLHAAEAAPLVEECLLACRGEAGSWVALLTGARNHSSSLGKGGGSLNAGLLEHLRAEGWRVFEPMAGVLCVQITA